MNRLTLHLKPENIELARTLTKNRPRERFGVDYFLDCFKHKNHNQCWEWEGRRNSTGYGQMSVFLNGQWKASGVHRFSACIFHALPLPSEKHALHRCDNPPCFNPYHLFIGDQYDNMADKLAKGRNVQGEAVHTSKLTENDVVTIRKRFDEGMVTSNQLAIIYDVSKATMRAIINRSSWKGVL